MATTVPPPHTIDLFLKIDGIKGESMDAKHKDEIVLESFSWGEANPTHPATGGGAGKVSMTDFHFTKKIDKATPKLMLACAQGQRIPSALMTARKPGEVAFEFLFYKFTNLTVTSVQESSDGTLPVDQVSFAFSKISVEYKGQTATGAVGGTETFSWDLTANKKL
jgi:type VI secretion system secreted protein Hcp